MKTTKDQSLIQFDSEKMIFHLQMPNSSYVIRIYGGQVLEHIYWGKKLDTLAGIRSAAPCEAGFSAQNKELMDSENTESITTELFPQEYPFFGDCDMRKPAFHACYKDGSRITKLQYICHEIYEGKPKLTGLPATYVEDSYMANTLEITMRDHLTGLTLLFRYTVFRDSDALCRNVEVINNGTDSISINSIMSCNVDFQRADFDFVNLSGAWARERSIERRALHTGTTKVESRRGSSSHHQSPFFALCCANADEEHGDVYGFSFVYSGNFEAGVEVDTYGQTRAFMGINSFDFNWKLNPGESFTAPEVVMVYSPDGFGSMSRTYHNLYRKRLARGKWRDLERPVLINNWEGTYFDFNEEKILNIARCAQKTGIEMLVLDDGWFGKRNSDTCSLGDWYVNHEKLPDGISGLSNKINALGMKFGLWFEPEMISPDSDLYREHPDWCLHVEGRGRSLCRNQLILDLSRNDVQEYVISFMRKHLSSANIEYIKWDMNRNMTCVGSAALPAEQQTEVYHRYILGLYKILECITSEFPDILFEGCSGGGGRFDAGQMYYFNQYWTSDDTDAVERMSIQYGTSLVMPAAFMSAHVSAVPNHQSGRISSMKTRGYVAMSGQFGYELDTTHMDENELIEISNQIAQYKQIREIIHNGDMYRTQSPFEGNHTCFTYVSADKKNAVLFYFTSQCTMRPQPAMVKTAGLDDRKTYQLLSTGELFSGSVLNHFGVRLHHQMDGESDMLVFQSIDR